MSIECDADLKRNRRRCGQARRMTLDTLNRLWWDLMDEWAHLKCTQYEDPYHRLLVRVEDELENRKIPYAPR